VNSPRQGGTWPEESSGITGLSGRDEVEMNRCLAFSCPDGVVVADCDGVVHLLRLPAGTRCFA